MGAAKKDESGKRDGMKGRERKFIVALHNAITRRISSRKLGLKCIKVSNFSL